MTPRSLQLSILPHKMAVCRLDAAASYPESLARGAFVSITRTGDELSIVCPESDVPPSCTAQRGWRCLKVAGPLDFNLTGVLASLVTPLAGAEVPVFVVSTYDTDYLLVKSADLDRTVEILLRAGHRCS